MIRNCAYSYLRLIISNVVYTLIICLATLTFWSPSYFNINTILTVKEGSFSQRSEPLHRWNSQVFIWRRSVVYSTHFDRTRYDFEFEKLQNMIHIILRKEKHTFKRAWFVYSILHTWFVSFFLLILEYNKLNKIVFVTHRKCHLLQYCIYLRSAKRYPESGWVTHYSSLTRNFLRILFTKREYHFSPKFESNI